MQNNRPYTIEICCFSLAEVQCAADAGADRIELCSGRLEGGVTPSKGLVEAARKIFPGKIIAMIRPRGGDFCYSDAESAIMKNDVLTCLHAGADGIVFGGLNADYTIDLNLLHEMSAVAGHSERVFHKAFDFVPDALKALDTLKDAGLSRVLTSGGQLSAKTGAENLKSLVAHAGNDIQILAGGKIDVGSIEPLWNAGIREFHFSASKEVKPVIDHPLSAVLINHIPDMEKIMAIQAELDRVSDFK